MFNITATFRQKDKYDNLIFATTPEIEIDGLGGNRALRQLLRL